MSELNKLVGKGTNVKLGELELTIRPLTVSSLPLLMQVGQESDPTKQAEAMKDIIAITLKDAIPDCTDEEIDKIPLEHVQKLMEHIMKVNKMDEMSDAKKELLKRVKRTGSTGNT